jgi:hypothetical protein
MITMTAAITIRTDIDCLIGCILQASSSAIGDANPAADCQPH